MTSRDYTKEIDLNNGEKKLPLFIAIPVLIVVAVGVWFGLAEVRSSTHREKPPEKVSATPSTTDHAVASR